MTLHVGLGTFQEVKTEDIREYPIHSESCSVSIDTFATIANTKILGKSIIAVGTTATRTLESLPYIWKHLDVEVRQGLSEEVCSFWDNLAVDDQPYIENCTSLENTIHFDTRIYIFE